MSEVQRARRTEDTFDRRTSRHDRRHSRSRSRERSGVKRKTRDEYEQDSRDRRDRDRDGHRDKRHDSRARSRSPKRESLGSIRRRSPPRGPRSERDRHRERERDNDRNSDSRPKTNGTSTPAGPRVPASSRSKVNGDIKSREVKMEDGLEDDNEETLMKKFMGFESFRSTKNSKVPGNDKNYGVRKEKKTEYRQYMNRTGGFNRPLSPG